MAETSIMSPAESGNPGLLAVGAANWATPSTIEDFSSRGPTTDGRVKPDIVGADRGATASSGTVGFSGTSAASPHVAGLAALVKQRFPSMTQEEVATYLKANALPRGASPNNTWGFGLAQLPALEPGAPTEVSAVAADGEKDGDSGSDTLAITVTSAPAAVSIPGVGAWGMIVLAALLGDQMARRLGRGGTMGAGRKRAFS